MSPTRTTLLKTSTLSTQRDTYIYTLARTAAHSAAAISSDDSLRIFDPETLGLVHTVGNAHKGLMCLRAFGSGYATAGRDAAVRCWDERTGKAGIGMSDSKGSGISALATCGEFLVAGGTESLKEGLGNVSVLLWDTRNPSTPLRQYTESHNDTITALSFHPSRPSTLLSAATDGLLSLFDTNIADEDDALLQVLNHKAAVHCAGFLSETEVYAVSSDEQLSVYTLSKPDDPEDKVLPIVELGDVRGALGCSYVIDIYPSSPAWIAAGDTGSSRMSMIPLLPSWSFDVPNAMDFAGAHGDEVVRDVLIDNQNQRILTCGEDGKVRLWAQEGGGAVQGEDGAMEVDDDDEEADKKKQKKKERRERKEKKKGEKERFNPY